MLKPSTLVFFCLSSFFILSFVLITPRSGKNPAFDSFYVSKRQISTNTGRNDVINNKKYVEMKAGSRWIVVTSIQAPTEDVKRLASQKGWNLVVVADKKTPTNWNHPNVHFLSLEKQMELDRLSDLLPLNSYTRKNLGYLYAIMKGAEWIYDTDDDNKPYGKGLDQFDYTTAISGLRYISSSKNMSEKLFNPYKFYGYENMWPRGFPLEYLKDHTNGKERMVLCRKMKPAAVQQGVVHNDPDVDAIFRLLYADRRTGLKAGFNAAAPSIILEEGTYSPWNSQNTLFHYKAFFTLFLPTSVAFRVTDIWRSFFAQKLLHLVGEQVAFYPVNAVQFRNAHNFLNDFDQEIDVYSQSGKIVEFLDSWNCSSDSTPDCVLELADEFVSNEFFGEEDRNLLGIWIETLKNIGYEFPKLIDGTFARMRPSREKYGNCRGANLDLGITRYTGLEQEDFSWASTALKNFGELSAWCSKAEKNFERFLPTPAEFQERYEKLKPLYTKKDTVLVLLNNYDWKNGIGLLQRLYAPFFKMVIFCGTWKPANATDLPIIEPVNYINLSQEEMYNGYFYNYCTSKVRDLRLQNVSGYYFVADDSIFNIWYNLTLDEVVHPHKPGPYGAENWWKPPLAAEAVRLFEEKYKDDEMIQKTWLQYGKRLKAQGVNRTTAENMKTFTGKYVSDFAYVPSHEMGFFADMFEVMTEAGIMVEIAYAKVFNALQWNRVGDNFTYLWGGNRAAKYQLYDRRKLGLHPMKMAATLSNLPERRAFCNTVVRAFAVEIYGQHNVTL